MNSYYVYVLLDPNAPGLYKFGEYEFNYQPFYVGKGKKNRYKDHFRVKETDKLPVKNKVRKIIKSGKLPLSIFPYTHLEEKEAYAKEILLIKEIGKENLTNICDGGEGVSSEMMIGEKNPQFGKKRPSWIIEKMQNARKITNSSDKLGKSFTDRFGLEKAEEIKLKQSKARKGKTYEEIFGEEKATMLKESQKLNRLNKTHSDETKQKMRAAQSPEAIAKRTKALLAMRKKKFDNLFEKHKAEIIGYIEKGLTNQEIKKRISVVSRYKLEKMLTLLRD